MHNKRGLTIVEVLIASAMMAVVIVTCMAFYLMARNTWIVCSLRMPLQRKASLAMEKMVRGIDGRNGVREADAGSVIISNSDTKIEYTSGIDTKERSFYLNGSRIMCDPDTSTAGDEFAMVTRKVSSLTFAITGNIVTINLGMQDAVKGKPINVDLQTEVRCRN